MSPPLDPLVLISVSTEAEREIANAIANHPSGYKFVCRCPPPKPTRIAFGECSRCRRPDLSRISALRPFTS